MRTLRLLGAVGAAALVVPTALRAQEIDERLQIHASLNAGYGRAGDLPVFGIPTEGTSDYRIFTLQFRYKLGEKDEIVTQFLNRRLGTSPIAGVLGDVTTQWAYWNHRFSPNASVKVGRNPLPRGLMNEIRYIGTLFPFYRPSMEVTTDAQDAIDGVVGTYSRALGGGVRATVHGFFGGSEHRALVSSSTGLALRVARLDNMFGGQFYLDLPIWETRVGAYLSRYQFRGTTGPAGYRTNPIFSLQTKPIDPVTVRAEYSRLQGYGPLNDNRSKYAQIAWRINDRWQLGGEHTRAEQRLFFANTANNRDFDAVRSWGVAGNYFLRPNVVLKAEHHWRKGYVWDVNVPPTVQTTPTVILAPPQQGNYFIVSLATSF
jgi:hypothetical protein